MSAATDRGRGPVGGAIAGSGTALPTDNDGRATGEMFLKTPDNVVYVWDGNSWEATAVGGGLVVSEDANNLLAVGLDGGAWLGLTTLPVTNLAILTIATQNVIPALPSIPANVAKVVMFVNGAAKVAVTNFTVVGTAVTWIGPGNVEPADAVFVLY